MPTRTYGPAPLNATGTIDPFVAPRTIFSNLHHLIGDDRNASCNSLSATTEIDDLDSVAAFGNDVAGYDEIERMAAEDEDNPGTDEADWMNATVGLPPRKTRIHATIDADVVDWFKSHGAGYQTRMNAVLRRYMEAQTKKVG